MAGTVQFKDIINDVGIEIQDVLPKSNSGYARTQRLKNQVLSAKSQICMERAKIVTKAYQETEGEHILIRRAKIFDRILSEISVYILKDELIVGHQSSKQRSAPLFPEFAVEWIDEEIETFETRGQDRFSVSQEDIDMFRKEILPYWKGKTFYDRVMSQMTEDIRLLRFDAMLFTVGLHEDGGLGHVMLDYEKVLKYGLNGIKEKIQEKLNNLDDTKPDNIKKKLFYLSALQTCDSVIMFANRYSDKAKEMSLNEQDPIRKKELETIAAICKRVPEHPAESFYEALQSFWFVQLVPQIYDNGVSITPGRFDQYMYPFYEKDIKTGVLTKAEAQELLEAMWIKFTEPIKVYRAADAASHAGYPMGQNLVVGGVGVDGQDATNDLSYRCIEAHMHIQLSQPNFSVRMHRQSPYDFVQRAAEAIRQGTGMPQIVNDETFVPALMNIGVTLKDARNYAPVGCVEVTPKDTWGRCNGGYFNLTKVLELAMSDGVCRISNKQVGLHTGDPKEFTSFDEILEAYKKQMGYAVSRLVAWDNILDMIHEELMPVPFNSILIDNCIESGKDVTSGGAKYNWTGPLAVGIANAGDSLMAIKKAVFDDEAVSMEAFAHHIANNFEDAEPLRKYLENKIPKYGNDEDEPDSMVKLATDIYFDSLMKYETYRGGPFVGALLPVSSYVAFGEMTGPTMDGRKSKEPLSDGISPFYGADKKGPTAVFKSVCKLDHERCPNGVIFNQKINPTVIESPEGLKKFIDLIKSYINLGGAHIQFNIISADTMRSAQAEPEKYRDLVVRVAGYSAFFNELSQDVQDTIIARTEQCL